MKRVLKWLFLACVLMAALFASGGTETNLLSCGSWQVVQNPNPGTYGDRLYGVTVVTASDVWAVGYAYISPSAQQTLVEHWDGTKWTVIPSANRPLLNNRFFDAGGIFTNDIWAVGSSVDSHGNPQSLIEHWNGSQWNIIPSPGAAELDGVAVVSAGDVWAVGSSLIEHWNGKKWSIVPHPSEGLFALAVVSADDVWAVGSSYRGGDQNSILVEHWDGKRWAVIKSPTPAGAYQHLWGVTSITADDVWAVGSYDNIDALGHLAQQPLIEHWNGAAWSIVPSPQLRSGANMLVGVTVTTTNNVWAVGDFFEHWNGSKWNIVAGARGILNDVMAVPGTDDVWAVGMVKSGQSLTEFSC